MKELIESTSSKDKLKYQLKSVISDKEKLAQELVNERRQKEEWLRDGRKPSLSDVCAFILSNIWWLFIKLLWVLFCSLIISIFLLCCVLLYFIVVHVVDRIKRHIW